ncbi:hypothetical protein [Salininema proteolyticum]|uniref:Uncharacterized protein n=1 Tax=Salininema proteolyticum TaxID=1607685 RepID=A0ABV8TSI1_9ACTN
MNRVSPFGVPELDDSAPRSDRGEAGGTAVQSPHPSPPDQSVRLPEARSAAAYDALPDAPPTVSVRVPGNRAAASVPPSEARPHTAPGAHYSGTAKASKAPRHYVKSPSEKTVAVRAPAVPDSSSSRPDDTPTVRRSAADLSPEEEMEKHLEDIRASRPLRRAAEKARRRTKWWMKVLAAASGLVAVAGCIAGSYVVLSENESAPAEPPPAQAGDSAAEEEAEEPVKEEPEEVVDPILARSTDSEPITAAELFGVDELRPSDTDRSYRVLGRDEMKTCSDAAMGDLADVIAETDCAQTVRATVASFDGEYAVTVGAMNLASEAEAESVTAELSEGLEGGFAAFRAGGESAELGRSDTMAGYNTYGHFLLYAVVGRSDGEAVNAKTQAVEAIVHDLVDTWLVEQLHPRRVVNESEGAHNE